MSRGVQSGPITPVILMDASQVITRMTSDGEMWTTVTERESDVFVQYSEAAVGATKYVAMIDLDNALFPHNIQGLGQARIDITSAYIALDAANNSNGILRIGVVRRIDDTNADIWYFSGIPFLASTTQFILVLRGTPSQVKLDMVGTQLQHGLTNSEETDVAAVNTATSLDSPAGAATVVPAKGDVIVKLEYVSGAAFNVGIFLFYHTQDGAPTD